MLDKELLFIIIGLLCCSIILLILVTVKLYISNCENNKLKENFANYNQLSQNKSIFDIANNSNANHLLNMAACHFYWNTSHNTYLSGKQIESNTNSVNNTINALNGGARYIEFDVYAGINDNYPIVAHRNTPDGINVTNSINFENHIIAVKNNAFTNTNEPLVIYLELYHYSNTNHMTAVKNIIQTHLGDKLYSKVLEWNNPGDALTWPQVPLKELKNKVIILVPGPGGSTESRNNYYGILRKVVHGFQNNGLLNSMNESNNYPNTTKSIGKSIWGLITNINNVGVSYDYNPQAHSLKSVNTFSRIYPYNITDGTNYGAGDLWSYNHNAVALNYFGNSIFGVGNIVYNKFKYANIVPIYGIIQNENKIALPQMAHIPNIDQWWCEYNNITLDIAYLKAGTILSKDSIIRSDNKVYELKIQSDGNLVLYKQGEPIWVANKKKKTANSKLTLQYDGNLILSAPNGTIIWTSGTSSNFGAFLHVQDDGNLVIYNKGKAIKRLN